MPKGRMLNKKISFDEVVANLSLKSALFFTWCIPNLDVEGKILGDFNYLKGIIVPYRKDFTLKDIEKCIVELHESGLILCYGNGYKYLKFNGFEKNQNVNPDKEAASEIPDPTPEQLQSNSRVTPGKDKISLNLNIREGKEEANEIQNVLSQWNSFAKEIGLETVIKLTDKRKKAIYKRTQEFDFDLQKIFQHIKESDFLRGKNNRGWKADFDFIFCSENNYLKILENKYGNNTNHKSNGATANDLAELTAQRYKGEHGG